MAKPTRDYPQLRDPGWLRQQYVDLGRSHVDIAAGLGCVPAAVRYRLVKLGIWRTPKTLTSNSSKYPQLHDAAWLREQYETRGRPAREIAREVGCAEASVTYHLREFGVPIRGRHHGRWNPKACERCGQQFTPSGPASRFCSPACRAGTKLCDQCGQEFRLPLPKGNRMRVQAERRFCSRTCEWDWRRANVVRLPTEHRRIRPDGYVDINLGPRGRIKEHILVMEQRLGRELLPGENVHHRNGVKSDNTSGNLELWVVHQPSGQRALDLLAWAEEIVARYAPDRDKL